MGGGSVFAIFASAAIATFGILPEYVVKSTENFVSNMGFWDFYIAALITGSILGMNRNLLMKASVRFIPVALISMVVSFFAVGLVGMLIGNGFANSVYTSHYLRWLVVLEPEPFLYQRFMQMF